MAKRGWHKEDIKAAIRKKGVTLKQLSVRHGLPSAATRTALSHSYTSAETVIAEFLGVPASDLWPERYRGDKPRRVWSRHSHLRNNIAPVKSRHRQSGEAA